MLPRVANEYGLVGMYARKLNRVLEDRRVWFCDPELARYQNKIDQISQAQEIDLCSLHIRRSVGDDAHGSRPRRRGFPINAADRAQNRQGVSEELQAMKPVTAIPMRGSLSRGLIGNAELAKELGKVINAMRMQLDRPRHHSVEVTICHAVRLDVTHEGEGDPQAGVTRRRVVAKRVIQVEQDSARRWFKWLQQLRPLDHAR